MGPEYQYLSSTLLVVQPLIVESLVTIGWYIGRHEILYEYHSSLRQAVLPWPLTRWPKMNRNHLIPKGHIVLILVSISLRGQITDILSRHYLVYRPRLEDTTSFPKRCILKDNTRKDVNKPAFRESSLYNRFSHIWA